MLKPVALMSSHTDLSTKQKHQHMILSVMTAKNMMDNRQGAWGVCVCVCVCVCVWCGVVCVCVSVCGVV